MKKIYVIMPILFLAFILFFIAGAVLAQDANSIVKKETTILPDSPIYFLKIWMENISVFFSLSEEVKIGKYLISAENRLFEAQKMLEKDKVELAQKLAQKYIKQMEKVKARLEKLEVQKGREAVKDISQKVKEATERHIVVLQGILERAPEQAKDALRKALEASQKGIQRAQEALDREKNKEEGQKEENKSSAAPNKVNVVSSEIFQVNVSASSFVPAELKINVGDKVLWKSNSVSFRVASDPHPYHTILPEFDSKSPVAVGGSYEFQFNKPGSFGYHDHLNFQNKGRVTVVEPAKVSISGVVKFINFEGGFWGVVGNDGKNYDPKNLPDALKKEGLKAKFTFLEDANQLSIHMWGKIVRVADYQLE